MTSPNAAAIALKQLYDQYGVCAGLLWDTVRHLQKDDPMTEASSQFELLQLASTGRLERFEDRFPQIERKAVLYGSAAARWRVAWLPAACSRRVSKLGIYEVVHGAPEETRDALRRAYVLDRRSLEVAAAICSAILYGTARRWKQQAVEPRGTAGTRRQSARLLAGGGLEERGAPGAGRPGDPVQATMEAIQARRGHQARREGATARQPGRRLQQDGQRVQRVLRGNIGTGHRNGMLQRLASFIRERFPQHAQAFAEVLEPFGEIITQRRSDMSMNTRTWPFWRI
ncbi:DUF1804 family protein [Pseudomonas aeruginosa]|uniref:DUF1804 family protein n=1 Tax=Pseudomonas aeruginosa TaxID=287 RepID=UPI003D7FE1E8